MRSELKTDMKKFLGHLVDTGVVLFLPLLMMILLESGMNVIYVAFLMGMYGAFMEGVLIINKKHMGTWTEEELKAAKEKTKGITSHTAETVNSVDNTELMDTIEAKKEDISIEEFKEKKYGDAQYDYGKSIAEKEAKEKEKQELMKKLAELNESEIPTKTIGE